MIYELSISSDYRTEWGVWEGLREVIQHMFDAGQETGKGTGYWHDGKAGNFVSHGARLETSNLLLDETNKPNMKIGITALLRTGHTVTMTQPGERWHFSLKKSKRYAGKATLHVNVRKHQPQVCDATAFQVGRLNIEDYKLALSRFLPDNRMQEGIVRGAIPGDIYVKGVFVTNMENYKYAYNLPSIEVSLAHKILDADALDLHRFYAFRTSLLEQRLPFGEALNFLESGAADAEFQDCYGSVLPETFNRYLQQVFQERYGEKTYPTFHDEDARQLQFAGYATMRPATKFLQYAYYTALHTSFAELMQQVGKYSKVAEEITTFEQGIWLYALQLLDLRNTTCAAQIVEFADEHVLGCYDNNTIKLARKQLRSLPETLATLIHEKAHWVSGDADDTPDFQVAMHNETVKLLEKVYA